MSEPPSRPVLAAISPNRTSAPRQHLLMPHGAMEGTVKEEDVTQQSLAKSDDSNISNLSLLSDEDHADDLHRRMLNHARQGQTRWSKRSALDSEPLNMHQPFRKSKPGLGLISMMRDPNNDRDNDHHLPTVGFATRERPPSPNFPRHWGRKGKQRNDFLKRLGATAVEQSPPSPYRSSMDEHVETTEQYTGEHEMSVDNERRRAAQKRHSMPIADKEPVDGNHLANTNTILAQPSVRPSRAGMKRPLDINDSTRTNPQSKTPEAGPPRKYGSRDLLQQLARAASLSPSPPKASPDSLPTQVAQDKDGSLDQRAREETKNAWSDFDKRHLPHSRTAAPARKNKTAEVGEPDQGDLSTLLDLDQDTLDLVSNVNVPLSKGEDLRSEEKEALQRMSKALRSVRTGLRDASLGIKRVRNQFAQADGQKSEEAGPCQRCNSGRGVTISHVLADTWSACRAYFYSRPKDRGGHLKFTWLGLVILVALVWLLTEVTLCEYYCHPVYAKYMVGYGVDIRRPRMPYVTTTIMIKRPLEWIGGRGWQTYE